MNGVTLFEMWVLYGYKVVFFQLSNYFTSEQDKITFNDSLFPTCLLLFSSHYTQSPIIKNGPIRNDAEILGKFKERTLSRSKLRNT